MNNIPYHDHDKINSPQVKIENIDIPILTTAPTNAAKDGTIVLVNDGASTFRLYIRLNGAWKYVALT